MLTNQQVRHEIALGLWRVHREILHQREKARAGGVEKGSWGYAERLEDYAAGIRSVTHLILKEQGK